MSKLFNEVNNIFHFLQYGDLPTSYYTKRGMKVGKCFNRQSNTKFDPAHCWLISIGDYVTIANRVIFLAHDDSLRIHNGYGKLGKIKVGNRVFIGAGTIVLPNVTIGDDVIIGSGSVVTKNIENGMVVAGVPAKVIGTVSELIRRNEKEMNENNTFDNSYAYDSITDSKKKKMNAKLENSIGFLKLKDFNQFK